MHIYINKNFDIHHDVIIDTHTHTHSKDDLQIKAIKTNKKA